MDVNCLQIVEFPIYSRFGISSLLFGPPNSTVNEHFDQIKELSMKRGLKCILPEHDLYSQLVSFFFFKKKMKRKKKERRKRIRRKNQKKEIDNEIEINRFNLF